MLLKICNCRSTSVSGTFRQWGGAVTGHCNCTGQPANENERSGAAAALSDCCCSVPQFGFGCAEDAVRLLHLRPAVAGVVHLQAVVQLVQVLLHLLDLLPGHVLQAKAHLAGGQREE